MTIQINFDTLRQAKRGMSRVADKELVYTEDKSAAHSRSLSVCIQSLFDENFDLSSDKHYVNVHSSVFATTTMETYAKKIAGRTGEIVYKDLSEYDSKFGKHRCGFLKN